MTIQETLELRTTGTSGVIALAEALERAGRAQKSLTDAGGDGRAAGRLAEIEAKRIANLEAIRAKSAANIAGIDARGSSQFQLDRQRAVMDLALERAKQEGQAARDIVRLKEKELALEKQQSELAFRRERERGLSARAATRASPAASQRAGTGAKSAVDALLRGEGADGVMRALGLDEMAVGVVGATAVVGVAAALGAAKFGSAVVEAQAYREDVTEALAVVAGGADQAKALLDRAAVTADYLGKKRADIAGVLLDLTTKGFDAQLSDRIIKSVADLGAIDPNASLEGVVKVLGKAQAQGRINLDILSELNTFGLEQGDVIKQIGKILGKNDVEVLKALSSQGGIRGLGVEPILAAINAQVGGGDAGAAAAAKAQRNMSSLIEQIKSIPSNVLFDLDVGPGLDATKGKMREIIAFFDASSESGKEVRRVVADSFNALAEGLFGIDTKKSGGITETLKAILDVVKNSRGEIKEFAAGVAAIGSGFAWVAGVGAKISGLKQTIDDFLGFSAPLGLFGSLMAAALVGPIRAAAEGVRALVPEFYQAGVDLVTGLANGVSSTAQAVIDAVTNAVGGAISWAKKLLGIASPSRVFMEMGAYTSEGFALGISANDNAVARAASAMAGGAVQGASGAAFAPPGQGGGIVGAGQAAGAQGAAPPTISIGPVTIQVSGAKDEEHAEQLGRAAGRGFTAEIDARIAAALRRVA